MPEKQRARLKSPQLYQLSYRPKSRKRREKTVPATSGARPTVPAMYPYRYGSEGSPVSHAPATCQILHSGPRFVQTECGRPAAWLTPNWRVCAECRREHLAQMPLALFRGVPS
jgi:hypothetical protein